MNIDAFFEAGYHFQNFDSEQLGDMFDLEEIEELPDSPLTQNAVYLLSQVAVGNITEPVEEIKKMGAYERAESVTVWVNVLNDTEQLRQVARVIVHHLI